MQCVCPLTLLSGPQPSWSFSKLASGQGRESVESSLDWVTALCPSSRSASRLASGHLGFRLKGAQSLQWPRERLCDPGPAPPRGPAPRRSALRGPVAWRPEASRGHNAQQRHESLRRQLGVSVAVASPDPREVQGRKAAAPGPGPMEARGELDPARESASGDLLLALLARRADLRRGGCPTERLHRQAQMSSVLFFCFLFFSWPVRIGRKKPGYSGKGSGPARQRLLNLQSVWGPLLLCCPGIWSSGSGALMTQKRFRGTQL